LLAYQLLICFAFCFAAFAEDKRKAPPQLGTLSGIEAKAFYFVDNPVNRYSTGDRTPGLTDNDDGSLTLSLQHEAPTDGKQKAN
jgi:hypothetical protein